MPFVSLIASRSVQWTIYRNIFFFFNVSSCS